MSASAADVARHQKLLNIGRGCSWWLRAPQLDHVGPRKPDIFPSGLEPWEGENTSSNGYLKVTEGAVLT